MSESTEGQNQPGEKKIIIDEDWKSRVEAEREAARGEQETPPDQSPAGSTAAAAEAARSSAGAAAVQGAPMPPANFTMLLSTLATEAMVALGQFPRPGEATPRVELEHAKYFIDTLEMLQDKTKGNLTPEESATLEDILHQLRMAFVAINNRAAKSPQ